MNYRGLLVSVLLLCSVWGQAWGATTYWVSNAGAGAADGTSQANAWAGWTSVNQTTVSAGDTLCVDGQITLGATATWNKTGSVGSTITIKGNCTGATQGVLDATGVTCPALQIGNASNTKYIILDHLTIQNCTASAGQGIVMFRSAGGGDHNTVQYSTIQNGGYYGLLSQQQSATVTYSTIQHCYDDCLGFTNLALNPVVSYNTIRDFSTGTTTGDAIFTNDSALLSTVLVEGNTIYWDEAGSTKQGFVGGVDTGTVIIRNNQFYSTVDSSANHAISVNGAGVAYVYGNYCEGYKACAAHFTSTAGVGIDTAMYVYGNIANGSEYISQIAVTVGNPSFYIYNNTGISLGTRGIDLSGTAGTGVMSVYNNHIQADSIALYVSNTVASYAGDGNNFYPEGVGFVQNYECGTTYATLAAYKAGCAAVDQSSLSTLGGFVAGPVPTTASGFKLKVGSALRRTGKGLGIPVSDYAGRPFYPSAPSIGAYEVTSNSEATDRTAAAARTARN